MTGDILSQIDTLEQINEEIDIVRKESTYPTVSCPCGRHFVVEVKLKEVK